MKLKHLALAALVPAAVAGTTVSAVAFAAPSAAHPHPARPAVTKTAATKSGEWVTVQRGQTLTSIARAHHISWDALVGTPPNTAHLRYPYHLMAGEHLRIPADPQLRAEQYRTWRAAQARAKAAAAAKAKAEAAAAAAAKQRAAATEASQPLTAGMSSYEQCVAWRESGDNPRASSAGLFGILPSTWAELGYSGTAGQASVAMQKVAFQRLYAQYGTQPWSPSDGC
jgi:nucleoid-associated protein YgaU